MSSGNDQIIREMKEDFKQIQRRYKTRRKGRRGPVEVYIEPEQGEEEIDQRVRREESARARKHLADISREYLKIKKVYRWQMKKVSELSDNDVIRACHFIVEGNRLNDEWEDFRESRETYY